VVWCRILNIVCLSGGGILTNDRDEAWFSYHAWNDHLADVLYPPLDDAAPAYLDLENEQCEILASRAGIAPHEVIPTLAKVVSATSDTTSMHAFRQHTVRLGMWRRRGDLSVPPPIFPLLAVFSLAAERMAGNAEMSSQNYYGRLAELVPMDRVSLSKSYQGVAELAWGTLNRWLEDLNGARGNPTAYSVGMRYVGLSVSQALIRETDRHRLRDFFVHFGFAPGSHLAPSELESYLDAWVASAQPSPAGSNIVRLWARSSLRLKIAEIVSTELEGWDGMGASVQAVGAMRNPILLTLGLPSFSRRTLALEPLMFTGAPTESQDAQLVTPSGDVRVELVPAGEGASILGVDHRLSNVDSLEGVLTINVSGLVLERQPKRLVVFKQSEISRRWVETSQVLLGDKLKALVNLAFAQEVRSTLAEVARPGWTETSDLVGLPAGWLLLNDLEIFARPSGAANRLTELSALLPMTSSQLKIEEGLRLPGRIRGRWHTDWPPEVRAISDGGTPFTLTLSDQGESVVDISASPSVLLESWEDGGRGSIVVSLSDLELEDGDYVLEMVCQGSVLLRKSLALRSSASADPRRWVEAESIVHDLTDPLSVVEADEPVAGGAQIPLQVVLDPGVPFGDANVGVPPTEPWWKSERSMERSSSVQLARPAEGSCFYTGRHHEVVPRVELDARGRPTSQTTVGRCKFCGLERRYSTDYYQNRRKFERAAARRVNESAIHHVDLSYLAAPQAVDTLKMWDAALDVLRFLGGGDGASLEFVARQLDSGGLFQRSFVRTLEELGHIEVRRDAQTQEVLAWEIGPTLILRSGDVCRLAGFWTHALRNALEGSTSSARVIDIPYAAGPAQSVLNARDPVFAAAESGIGVSITDRPGWAMLSRLPRLAEVIDALPVRPMPQIGLQWFDVATASWRDVSETSRVGAYRTTGYSRTYVFRSQRHVDEGVAVAADHAFVKHSAAREIAKKPLLAYSSGRSILVTPIGAELPGLYARAISIETGRPGVVRKNFVVYEGVPADLAGRLVHLLTS
jgi:hypothetical protein